MPTNLLWLIHLHVRRGTNRDMPADLVGATVPAFAGAPDSDAAAKAVVTAVAHRGFEFVDIVDRQVHQVDPLKWDAYVAQYPPEHIARFPPQSEIAGIVDAGKVFFGPFAGYEREQEQ